MKICYLDESGHCGEKIDPNQQIETIVGVIIDVTKLFKTQKEHNGIIEILKEAGIESAEIKSAEIYKGRKDWSIFDEVTRYKLYELLLTWAVSHSSKFVICPIDSFEFFRLKSEKDPIALALKFPFEAAAFNAVLSVQREFNGTNNNKGRTIMVFDEQKNHDKRLIKIFEGNLEFTDTFTKHNIPPKKKTNPRFDQIVDIPHFSKSHMTVLIQIADIEAYVINRHIQLENGIGSKQRDGERELIKKWYKMIGQNIIKPTSIDPPGKNDALIDFYRKVRPFNWRAKNMK